MDGQRRETAEPTAQRGKAIGGVGELAMVGATVLTSGRAFTLSNAVWDVAANRTDTLTGSLNGFGGLSLIKSNSGVLALTGGGTVAGQTVVKEGTLRIGGGVWSGNITNAAGVLIFDPSASATVSGNISGQGGITMQGGGTLLLTGNNTGLEGGLLINNGTVAVNSNNALGQAGAAVVITSGTLRAVSTYSSSRTLTTVVAATLSVDAGQSNTWSGSISGAGNITKSGAGELVLSALNDYSGTTLINGGTLRLNGTLSTGGGLVTVAGGTLAGTGTIFRTVTLTNGVIVAGNNAPGTLTVSNLNWESGGTYRVFATSTNGTPGVNWSYLNILSNVTFNGGGFIVDLISTNNYSVATNWLIATAAGGITGFNSSQFSVITTGVTGSVDGAFGISTNGNNGLLLTLSSGFVWNSLVNSNWQTAYNWSGAASAPPANQLDTTLIFRGNGVASNDHTSFIVTKIIFDVGAGSNQELNGGTLIANGYQAPSWEQRGVGNVTIANALVLSNTLAMSGSGLGTVTVSGVISGTNFTKTGNWTLNLLGANTFTGNVSIIGGALGWNNGTALGYTGNVVTLSNVMLVAGVNTINNALAFGGAVSLTNSASGTLSLLGGISGSGMLTQQVATLILGGGGTYNGGVVLPTSGALIFSNQPSQWLAVNGVISGAGSVTKTAGGTVTLGGANTYTGDTKVEGGTLIVGHSSALGNNAGSVTVADTGAYGAAGLLFSGGVTFNREVAVINSGGATARVGSVSGTATLTGQLTLSDDVVLHADSGSRIKFAGVMTNTASVEILTGGGGIIELAGTNKLTSGITVSSATLMVNDGTVVAAGTNLITVTSSGVLAGSGLVATSSVSGTVAPGDGGVGTLTLVDSGWNSGARYNWDLGDTSQYDENGGMEGTHWDFVVVSNLTLAAGTYTVDINSAFFTPGDTDGTNSYRIGWANNGSWSNGATWAANWVGAHSGYDGYGWWVTTAGGGSELWLNYGAGDFTYGALVVPEPNVLLLWLSSLATIYAARRRLTRSQRS